MRRSSSRSALLIIVPLVITYLVLYHVPSNRESVEPETQILLDDKIRLMLRVLGRHGQTHIVLGALGCGAFRNPPQLIARTFKRIIAEDEWKGYFEKIVFAVLDYPGGPNITIFTNILVDTKTSS